jgi:hypothetical protein
MKAEVEIRTVSPSAREEGAKRLEQLRRRRTRTTVLEIVWIVSEITPDDDEVVATVLHMIRSAAVRGWDELARQSPTPTARPAPPRSG